MISHKDLTVEVAGTPLIPEEDAPPSVVIGHSDFGEGLGKPAGEVVLAEVCTMVTG
jgi:hypothetical protein